MTCSNVLNELESQCLSFIFKRVMPLETLTQVLWHVQFLPEFYQIHKYSNVLYNLKNKCGSNIFDEFPVEILNISEIARLYKI